MKDLCEARRISISQIQKYLFAIQVNPVLQVLGAPPSKDTTDFSEGTCNYIVLEKKRRIS